MNTYIGQCRCGQTTFKIKLPETLDQYCPRVCDCDFCTTRKIFYISDPKGKLEIESSIPLQIQRQGSQKAGFLTCSHCKSVISATFQFDNKLLGALNSKMLIDSSLLKKPIIISPKALDSQEKVNRWQALWLNVKVNGTSI